MKKNLHLIKNTLGIATILFLSSCRSSDPENTLTSGEISAVSFNLIDTEYADSGKLSGQTSLAKGNMTNSENQILQSHSILVTPSSVITAELSPSMDASKALARAPIGINNPIAAISGNPLTSGMMFRVIAYRNIGGAYHKHQDYTVGQTAIPMMLDNGVAYNIIVYSYGNTSLPVISSGEQNNLSSAVINYNDTNRDFMYQKISLTPTNSTNTLNITLRHKIAQITTTVNSEGLGLGNITGITGGVLTPHYSNGIYPLSSGDMTAASRTTLTSGVPLSFTGLNIATVTADPVFVNADTGGNVTGGFSVNIIVGGASKTISLPNSFKITPENKSNLVINLVKCGAYIGPRTNPANYKEFMCQNLGATEGTNPFSPEAGNLGAKYQWGAKEEAGRYISQSNDLSTSGTISSWIGLSLSNPKPDGSWSDTSKAGNDPCPSGYRVPSSAEWQAVITNNPNVERTASSWLSSPTNYTSALYIRNASNVRTLMLPAAGARGYEQGELQSRGQSGDYWSSSLVNAANAYFLYFNNTTINPRNTNYRTFGFSVRCIAE